MEWIIVNVCIAVALCVWIIASYGYGVLCVNMLAGFYKTKFSDIVDCKFNFLLKGLVGIIFLTSVVQILNFFIPINAYVSLSMASVGIILFVYYFRQERVFFASYSTKTSVLVFLIAFMCSAIFACISDFGAYDTGLYHLQVTKWIEQSPINFGIANIHTRFGFNNIFYNFAALTEVSKIFPSTRCFIANKIIICYFLSFGFFGLLNLHTKKLNDIFACASLICMGLSFSLLNGLYADGIVGLLALGIVGYAIFCLEYNVRSLNAFMLLFLLAFFAIYIKISAFFLLICVLCVYIQVYGINWQGLKHCAYMFVICGIIGVFWALKGIFVSGMIAYPVGFLHFTSLPYAISEATRQGEALTILYWAQTYGNPNASELIQNGKWFHVWLAHNIKTKSYLTLLLWGFACLFGIIALAMYKRIVVGFSRYILIGISLLGGLVFWFINAPDIRFGYGYFFPLFALFFGIFLQNLLHDTTINPKFLYKTLVRGGQSIIIAMLILAYCDIKHLIPLKSLVGFTNPIKIHSYPINESITESNLHLYYPREGDQVGDAPLPAAPGFIPELAKKQVWGRDMYYLRKNTPDFIK